MVGAAGCEVVSIRTERCFMDLSVVWQSSNLPPSGCLDHARRVVCAGGGDEFTIRMKHYRRNDVLMLQPRNLFARLGHDHSCCIVFAGGGQKPAIGAKRHSKYGALMQSARECTASGGVADTCI